MNRTTRVALGLTALLATVLLLDGCAPGNERFVADSPAGFFWGIWHGLISFFTLIIGIFSDTVHVYERNNTGGWYDFGFVLGVACAWGAKGKGGEATWHKTRPKTEAELRSEQEWEEVGHKVEAKLKRELRKWAEAEPDEDWDEVEKKAETKLREVVKEWAEKE
jgi:hypothetical protein